MWFCEGGFPNILGSASAGDSQSIWNINSLRGKSVKHYTLATGFACAKVIIPGTDIITQHVAVVLLLHMLFCVNLN